MPYPGFQAGKAGLRSLSLGATSVIKRRIEASIFGGSVQPLPHLYSRVPKSTGLCIQVGETVVDIVGVTYYVLAGVDERVERDIVDAKVRSKHLQQPALAIEAQLVLNPGP